MRAIPSALQTSLDSGATTLCRCWQLTRRDGAVMGFTDHDRNVSFDGLTFEADAGLTSTAIERSTGLSVDTHTVSGALQSAAITDVDIERGLYDGAEVILWLVDWRAVSERVLVSRGRIGEIRRRDGAFEAEIAGLAERLNRPVGRAYLHSCDCRLGEVKCGVDLGAPEHAATVAVTALLGEAEVAASGLVDFQTGWFTNGGVTWVTGANAGAEGHVKLHLRGGVIQLWLSPAMPVALGDEFRVTAGCDKTVQTCREKFDNLLNFRGFPHMPGDDWATGYPSEGGAHDGGSLYRS